MIQDFSVTIVVVPRERFSCSQASLESIYEYTEFPFKLIYIDGNSPNNIYNYLKEQATVRNFKLIRKNSYLYPNQARNIALKYVDTKYVVFIDNDVIVSPGWLKKAVQCAEENGATVVGPLVCQYEPLHTEVHCAGGIAHIEIDVKGRRVLRSKLNLQGQKVAKVRPGLQQTQTEHAEFHCVLIRSDIFTQLGSLDENLFSYCEHQDFCMSVVQAGGTVYFEPDSIVTYLPGKPVSLADWYFYILRWNESWLQASITYFMEKWSLSKEYPYLEHQIRAVRRRRITTAFAPLSRSLSFGWENKALRNVFKYIDQYLNPYIAQHYAQSQTQSK